MTESQLSDRLSDMLSRIDGLQLPQPIKKTIGELRREAQWDDWSDSPGIYYFVHSGKVVYIGRAFPSVCIGNRVGSHIGTFDDPEWAKIISDDETIVGVLPFPPDDWHWIATIEVWLIDGPTRPQFNKRL